MRRVPIHLFTDSESTLESLTSSKKIVTKTLRMVIMDLKERLLSGEITSIAWLPTKNMWADLLTKESKLPEALEDVLIRNVMDIEDTTINKVKAHAQEVRMTNIQNRMKPDVLVRNVMDIEDTTINEVKAHCQEMRMTNI